MLAMTSVTFRNKTPQQILSICRRYGIEAIEWGADVHVPPQDSAYARRIGELTRASGMEVCSYGSYYRVGQDNVSDFTQVLESCKALGAPVVRVWCGTVGSQSTSQELRARYIGQLQQMCDMAQVYGIVVACEFHNNTYNDTADSARDLIRSVDRSNYRTYWQPVTYDERDLQYLQALRDHVVRMHVFSWRKDGKRYALSKQQSLWRQYLAVCDVPRVMEFVRWNSVLQFAADARTLRRWLEMKR